VKKFRGYKQGKQTGNFVPSYGNLVKKHYYLHWLFENCAFPENRRKCGQLTLTNYTSTSIAIRITIQFGIQAMVAMSHAMVAMAYNRKKSTKDSVTASVWHCREIS
jgi:hypothetical protein